jgi:hypothetical protein
MAEDRRQLVAWDLSNSRCGLCDSPVTLHFYPRGPNDPPGNQVVCTNPECDASVEGAKRRLATDLEKWGQP